MMMSDEIRHHRQQAERDAALDPMDGNYIAARSSLALWTIAETLYEMRENFAMVIDGAASIRTRTGE